MWGNAARKLWLDGRSPVGDHRPIKPEFWRIFWASAILEKTFRRSTLLMLDWMLVWGVSTLGGFVFKDVLLPLLKGALEDYTKDFFKDSLKGFVNKFKPDVLNEAAGKALLEFLKLVQKELQDWDVPESELPRYATSLEMFVYDKEVEPLLGQAFSPDCLALDSEKLTQVWKKLTLRKLPEEFDWRRVSKQYVKRVKELIAQSPDLSEIFQAKTLVEIERNTAESLGVVPEFDLRQYRETIQECYGKLRLYLLTTTTDEAHESLKLWNVFIPQNAREGLPPSDLPKEHQRQLRNLGLFDPETSAEAAERYREVYQQQPIRSVLEIVTDASCQYAVILGDPGSGKSSLVQYITLDWAENPTPALPLLIELRKYTRDENSPKSFLEFFHQGARAIWHLNQRELDEQLKSGQAIVMFDGLDEVFEKERRDTVITEIKRFTNEYPRVRVIVTSRVIGYVQQPLQESGFRHFTLQNFAPDQITQFLQKWHDLAFGNHPDRPGRQTRLQRAIDSSQAIRELAGNPLLLTMMAILNRNQELPRDRPELYSRASEVLLHKWDAEKVAPKTIGLKEKQAMLR